MPPAFVLILPRNIPFLIRFVFNHKISSSEHTNLEVSVVQTDKHFHKKEDMTKYGEFVCSAFRWLPIEKQKEQVEKMEIITRKNK